MSTINSDYTNDKYTAADPIKNKQNFKQNTITILYLIVNSIWIVLFATFRGAVGLCMPAKLKCIRNQVALVTGGGNGLGRAICYELAKHGCHVAIFDVDFQGALASCQELDKFGIKSKAYQGDVSIFEQVKQLQENIETDLGPVDILINNAGVIWALPLQQGANEGIQKVINVNLLAHFWTCRIFLDGMQQRRRGHIVAVSSLLGIKAHANAIAYSATKFGVKGMMDGIRDHLRWNNSPVNVTTVYPSLINTRKKLIEQFFQNLSTHMKFTINCVAHMDPSDVAVIIVNGMRQNKRSIYMRAIDGFIYNLFPVLPTVLHDLVQDYMVPRTSFALYNSVFNHLDAKTVSNTQENL